MIDISVTLPVYGNFDYDRLKLSIKSAKRQENCNVEIIVSEQNTYPKLKELSKEIGFIYVYSKPTLYEGKIIYNLENIVNKMNFCSFDP